MAAEAIDSSKPMQLISKDSDKWIVHEETSKSLEELKQKVVTVSIVGPYQSGKSFLMNRIADKPGGFQESSHNGDGTHGIWIRIIDHPKETDCKLVLMDTEGLGNPEKNGEKYDLTLLVLTMLLSNIVMFNCKSPILEKNFSDLHQAISYVNGLKKMDKDSKLSGGLYNAPKFVWLLRDCDNEVNIDGKAVTEPEYLEYILQLRQSSCDDVLLKNATRTCFTSYFTNRMLFAFSHPTMLRQPLNYVNITEDFKKSVNALKSHIRSSSLTSSFPKDATVEGCDLASICRICISVINDAANWMKPFIVSFSWKKIDDSFEKAMEDYTLNMKAAFSSSKLYDCNEIERIHQWFSEAAMKVFHEAVILDPNGMF